MLPINKWKQHFPRQLKKKQSKKSEENQREGETKNAAMLRWGHEKGSENQ